MNASTFVNKSVEDPKLPMGCSVTVLPNQPLRGFWKCIWIDLLRIFPRSRHNTGVARMTIKIPLVSLYYKSPKPYSIY